MYCEKDQRECASFFCKGKCFHDKLKDHKESKPPSTPIKAHFRPTESHNEFQVPKNYSKELTAKRRRQQTYSQSAEEGIDCYVHSAICHDGLCEQNGCKAIGNPRLLPVKKTKREREQRWRAPKTMKEKTAEEKPEIVFAERLKRVGECTKCGHYKPCMARCFPVMLKSGKVVKP